MKYITLVELRKIDYVNKKALTNFIRNRVSTVDHLSTNAIGYLPKSMYSLKTCIRAFQERIIAANNSKSAWIKYITTWEEHIEVLEKLKGVESRYHE